MDYVLVALCNPQTPLIDNSVLSSLSNAAANASCGTGRMLGDGVAYEFDAPNGVNLSEVKLALGEKPIDLCLVPKKNREKKLLIADMDSTMIEQECIDELAEFVGKRDEIAGITERAMRGELDFEAALKERVAMLAGLEQGKLQQAFEERITFTPGGRTLVQTMRARGGFTALVSGGFTFFTERVAAHIGFEAQQANQLLIEDGALTGQVSMPILGRAAKEEALRAFAADKGLSLNETMAVGDGANDLSMLGASGLGVAFRAKPAVAEAAHTSVNHGDLTALLYLQGIPQDEFTS